MSYRSEKIKAEVIREICLARKELAEDNARADLRLRKSKAEISEHIDELRDGVCKYGVSGAEYSNDEQNKLLDALDNVTRVLEDLQA